MEKISKNKIEILNLFRKDIFLKLTIREISISLKKPYPRIFETTKNLEKQKIIEIKKIGNSNLCSLSFSKESLSILSFLDEQEAIASKIPNIDKILEFKEFKDDIIIIAGSYAKGKQTGKSDIDIVIITKKDSFKKQKLLENLTLTLVPEFHPISFSYKDFIDMLLSKEQNFGKEVFNNHMIFRNAGRYYLLLKEAVENGFRS